MGVQFEGSHSFIVHYVIYNYVHTHTELLTDIDCAQCCHITVLSNV